MHNACRGRCSNEIVVSHRRLIPIAMYLAVMFVAVFPLSVSADTRIDITRGVVEPYPIAPYQV